MAWRDCRVDASSKRCDPELSRGCAICRGPCGRNNFDKRGLAWGKRRHASFSPAKLDGSGAADVLLSAAATPIPRTSRNCVGAATSPALAKGAGALRAMYEVDQHRDAYREGLFARALGLSCDVNPYPDHSREAFLWIHGWWLIQDEAEIARERGSLSSLHHLQLDEVSPNFPHERGDPVSLSISRQIAEAVRPLLTGLLLAAAGFSLCYAVLRIFLL